MATGGEGVFGFIVVAAGLAAIHGWFSDKSKKLKEDEFNRARSLQLDADKRHLDQKTAEEKSQLEQKAAEMDRVFQKRTEHLAILRREFEAGYPMIKCNINQATNEKIYHLPFDQQYDRTKIIPENGEFYATTVAEAERKGFRRALRHFAS